MYNYIDKRLTGAARCGARDVLSCAGGRAGDTAVPAHPLLLSTGAGVHLSDRVSDRRQPVHTVARRTWFAAGTIVSATDESCRSTEFILVGSLRPVYHDCNLVRHRAIGSRAHRYLGALELAFLGQRLDAAVGALPFAGQRRASFLRLRVG